MGDSMFRTAAFSDCGLYRYSLTRRWADGPRALFVMLNPSTADATADDPTIRRCISFARREGCGAIEVVNCYALRSTSPAALRMSAIDIVGPHNRQAVEAALQYAARVICAWGAHPVESSPVPALLAEADRWCLGVTADGSPRHPLYVRADAPLLRWPVEVNRE